MQKKKKKKKKKVEIKDNDGCTPINIASRNGHLKVVKYLYETCQANGETKDGYGRTPINDASLKNNLEVIKYLYETWHAKITEEEIQKYESKEIKDYFKNINL